MTEETNILSVPQPIEFSATFTVKITGLRTQTVGDLANVVKQVEWTITGTDEGQTFELPQTTTVPDPEQESFVQLENLTETQVVEWIETHDTRLLGVKAHIQQVLDREVAQAGLIAATMPWAAPQE